MQFTIEREQLLKPLQFVNGIVKKRQILPILDNVLLVVQEKKLCLIASDLEVELVSHSDSLVSGVKGEITVSARKLFDICRSLPERSKLKIKLVNHKLYVMTENSRFILSTLPAVEFPRVQEEAESINFTLNIMQLKHMIERTQFAMAQQDVRYYLNGCLLYTSDAADD